jgi:hypothetical protein
MATGFTNILTKKNKSIYYQYVMSSLLALGPAVFAMEVIIRRAHKKQRDAQADADDAAGLTTRKKLAFKTAPRLTAIFTFIYEAQPLTR